VEQVNILIADDSDSHLKLMESVLRSKAYSITTARDGHEVLAHLRDHTPDLIVMDIHMPGLTGIDICGRIRRIPRLQEVPVILVTAGENHRLKQEAEWVKATSFLRKPVSNRDIREQVWQALRGRMGIGAPDPAWQIS
jgi:two-component system alkaline phosphatase synthesis response regulator PhoP